MPQVREAFETGDVVSQNDNVPIGEPKLLREQVVDECNVVHAASEMIAFRLAAILAPDDDSLAPWRAVAARELVVNNAAAATAGGGHVGE